MERIEFVSISKKDIEKLSDYRKASIYETCGILLGVIKNDRVNISTIIADKSRKTSRFSVIRTTKGVYQDYRKCLNMFDAIDYVGEWHTHPSGGAEPSWLDDRAMNRLLRDPDYEYPLRLVLCIAGRYSTEFYLYEWNKARLSLKSQVL